MGQNGKNVFFYSKTKKRQRTNLEIRSRPKIWKISEKPANLENRRTATPTGLATSGPRPPPPPTHQDHFEALDGVLERHQLALGAGENLGHLERLAEEALDLARARHRQLVLLRQLVHAEDGDDVLQRLVVLQR